MIRKLISLVIFVVFVVFATTVPLGKRTLWGHVSRIWKAPETQELVDGVKDSAGPLVDKAKRGAKAGWEAIQGDGGPVTDDPKNDGKAGQDGEADQDKGVLNRAREEAVDKVADEVGDMAKDVAKKEVKSKLSGD